MKVCSIYSSINGEVNNIPQGSLITILRLAGCNLKCTYCDSVQSQNAKNGKEMSNEEIFEKITEFGNSNLLITGGEPLLQQDELICFIEEYETTELLSQNIIVETNGSIIPFDLEVGSIVMDYKLPSSGMEQKMDLNNFYVLTDEDFVKFVVQDWVDFARALEIMEKIEEYKHHVTFLFSPISNKLHPKVLHKWMKERKLNDCILNLQLHKYIWPKGEKEK